jgi:formamidopyrimidine-DNA glycosylase
VPELPEVETVVRDLRPHLVGRRLAAVRQVSRQALRKPWSAAWDSLLVGRRVEGVGRRGKWIVLGVGGGSSLVFHLGMTGQLTLTPAGEPLAPHTHLVFGLDGDDRQLRFRDIRRFGSATLFAARADLESFFAAAGLGPEPFGLSPGYWKDRLAATGRCLKAVLLDQRVVAGVGNIYADEALFQARLHPGRLGRDLDAGEVKRLARAVPTVLERAIRRRGSSIRNYVGGLSQRGGYQNEFRVYGRTGAACPRCGTAIARVRLAGRSTHFCPKCQKGETTNHTNHTNNRKAENRLTTIVRERRRH